MTYDIDDPPRYCPNRKPHSKLLQEPLPQTLWLLFALCTSPAVSFPLNSDLFASAITSVSFTPSPADSARIAPASPSPPPACHELIVVSWDIPTNLRMTNLRMYRRSKIFRGGLDGRAMSKTATMQATTSTTAVAWLFPPTTTIVSKTVGPSLCARSGDVPPPSPSYRARPGTWAGTWVGTGTAARTGAWAMASSLCIYFDFF
ncbi:hypothetical protein C8F01DRAFT_1375669 [Mycena amicta]|nr:hypothetical protein C8F01DRAFT_1238506 [Mycena amicta]KAJ7052871.1 hypothetical protein C8F01DRAFT_1375669 [Mycena amicta]